MGFVKNYSSGYEKRSGDISVGCIIGGGYSAWWNAASVRYISFSPGTWGGIFYEYYKKIK